MPRTWRMFAGRVEPGPDGSSFRNFGEPHYVRMYGHEPVEVELTEDPEGGFYGWIYADRPDEMPLRRTGIPVMIQPDENLFRIQFPYALKEHIAKGDGEVVRMSCREIRKEGRDGRP